MSRQLLKELEVAAYMRGDVELAKLYAKLYDMEKWYGR